MTLQVNYLGATIRSTWWEYIPERYWSTHEYTSLYRTPALTCSQSSISQVGSKLRDVRDDIGGPCISWRARSFLVTRRYFKITSTLYILDLFHEFGHLDSSGKKKFVSLWGLVRLTPKASVNTVVPNSVKLKVEGCFRRFRILGR